MYKILINFNSAYYMYISWFRARPIIDAMFFSFLFVHSRDILQMKDFRASSLKCIPAGLFKSTFHSCFLKKYINAIPLRFGIVLLALSNAHFYVLRFAFDNCD